MKYSYEELAGMIDHSLLHPTMTDEDIRKGCELARRHDVATACVKPYSIPLEREGRVDGTLDGAPGELTVGSHVQVVTLNDPSLPEVEVLTSQFFIDAAGTGACL